MYYHFYYFIIYSFIGWTMETCYAMYKHGRFINRGFLYGPFCPVYGFGAVIIIVVLSPLKNDALMLFVGGAFLTSVLEYATGFILEKAFHTKWWDYSNRAYNIRGRICLKFSLLWGILAVIILNTLHPFIHFLVIKLPQKTGIVISRILFIYLLADLCVTIGSTINLNINLRKLNQLSIEIKERIEFMKSAKISYPIAELHKKIELLTSKYEALLNRSVIKSIRLLDAFPGLKSVHFNETLNDIKTRLKTLRNKNNRG